MRRNIRIRWGGTCPCLLQAAAVLTIAVAAALWKTVDKRLAHNEKAGEARRRGL